MVCFLEKNSSQWVTGVGSELLSYQVVQVLRVCYAAGFRQGSCALRSKVRLWSYLGGSQILHGTKPPIENQKYTTYDYVFM